jgi:hypothetical protein
MVVGGVEDGRGGMGGGGSGFSAVVVGQVVMRWIRRRAAPPLVWGLESWASRRGSCGWCSNVNVMTMARFVGDIFVKWEFATPTNIRFYPGTEECGGGEDQRGGI